VRRGGFAIRRLLGVSAQSRIAWAARCPVDRVGGIIDWTTRDTELIERTVVLALEAEARGDVPVGSLVTLDDEIVAEGSARVLSEGYQPRRHAEQEALSGVPIGLWSRAREMTCYTSLEPCLMCFGSLLLCGVGRIVFGGTDVLGGARFIFDAMPPYYVDGRGVPAWDGPVLPDVCGPLYERVDARFRTLPCG
jgi:tRNA(adenine34) deaminase